MKKIISAIALCIIVLQATAQKKKLLSTHIEFIQQRTITDRTIENNPWGTGLGLQTLFNPNKKFNPLIDLSAFVYLGGKKIAYLDENENFLPPVDYVVNLFAGFSYKPNSILYFSVTGGPSFVSDQTLFGIKPAIGFYFSPAQKWRGQIAYLNVFNRGIEGSKKNFESIAFSIGLKLF